MKRIITAKNLGKALARPLFAAEYLKGKLKAEMGYRFGGGHSLLPGRTFFALTGRCNLKCRMCPQYNHPSFREEIGRNVETTGAELRRIVDDISSFRPLVLVSGGELFLHPAWFEFISYVKEKSLFCSIGTNGTFLEANAPKLVEIELDEISVSLDGPSEIHDEIRGIPGTYAKAVSGIRSVMEERRRAGSAKPLINVIFTVTSMNHKYLVEMVELMEALQIDTLRIGHLNHLSPREFDRHMTVFKNLFDIEHDTSWSGFVTESNGIDAAWLADTMERLRAQKRSDMRLTFYPDFKRDEIVRYYTSESFRSTSFKDSCLAPWDIAIIGPSGEVILCPNYIIGNLREQNFKEIWNNEKAVQFRKKLLKAKKFPACDRGCCFFYM